MNWVRKSIRNSKRIRDHYKMHEIDIYIKEPLPEHINADLVFSSISKMIPSHLLRGIDIIYVGEFKVFKEKRVNAVYQDGAIYVTNNQDIEEDMIDDIIHECAHSVEETFKDYIYNDNLLKREFLGKRRKLHALLDAYSYKPPSKLRSEVYYDKEIDMYLYKDVGYETLWNMIGSLFPTPYSITSLREYFAIGFEEHFMKGNNSLKRDCPLLYSKLIGLEYMEDK